MSEDRPSARVWRIGAVVLQSKDPDGLARFYRDAFDFVDEPNADPAPIDDTRCLWLGPTRLRIRGVGADAAAYPDDVPGWSPLFQHFALRVADMDAAMERLASIAGWRPISIHGPQRLPPNTGSVTAFKFRDPDGHPLEFLAFPGRTSGPLFAGIDHSAISVADAARSIAFYEGLGLAVAGRSSNTGPEQARLDGIDDATVDVVALRMPSGSAPHLELLAYRGPWDRASAVPARADDVVATSLMMEAGPDSQVADDGARVLCDPDGHRLRIVRAR